MKNVKLLSALIILLFSVSTLTLGQTSLPLNTYVEDMPNSRHSFESLVTVTVEWYGVTGKITKTVTTTVAGLWDGINVTSSIFSSSEFSLPVTHTTVFVDYPGETHYTKYPYYATQAIRATDPNPWVVYTK